MEVGDGPLPAIISGNQLSSVVKSLLMNNVNDVQGSNTDNTHISKLSRHYWLAECYTYIS
jgi:hypothetical protein